MPYPSRANPGATIGSAACGPEAALNVIINIPGAKQVTPEGIAQWMIDKGYRVNGGTVDKGVKEAIDYYAAGLASTKEFNLNKMSTDDAATLISNGLKNGAVFVVSGRDNDPATPATSGGHFYVLRELDQSDPSRVFTLDPNATGKSTKSWNLANIVIANKSTTGIFYMVTPNQGVTIGPAR